LYPTLEKIGHVELSSKKSQRDGSVEKDNRKVSSWQSEIVEKIMSSNIVNGKHIHAYFIHSNKKGNEKK
jgi:hypothetical protein